MCTAPQYGRLDIVKYLIDNDVQIIEGDYMKDSLLHAACLGGLFDVIRFW